MLIEMVNKVAHVLARLATNENMNTPPECIRTTLDALADHKWNNLNIIYAQYSINKLVNKHLYSIQTKISFKEIGL